MMNSFQFFTPVGVPVVWSCNIKLIVNVIMFLFIKISTIRYYLASS